MLSPVFGVCDDVMFSFELACVLFFSLSNLLLIFSNSDWLSLNNEKNISLKKMQNHLYRNYLFIFPMRGFVLFATMAFIQTKQEKNLITFMNYLVIKINKTTLKKLAKNQRGQIKQIEIQHSTY